MLPTYCCPMTMNDTSCLDHIIHNLNLNAISYVLKPNLSDHYAVVSVFEINYEWENITIQFRNYSQANINSFIVNLDDEFNGFQGDDVDVDKFDCNINTFYHNLMDKYFPIKKKFVSSKRIKTPWINNDIRDCITKKHI